MSIERTIRPKDRARDELYSVIGWIGPTASQRAALETAIGEYTERVVEDAVDLALGRYSERNAD